MIKVVSADAVDAAALRGRLAAVRRLAGIAPAVCAPLDLDGAIISSLPGVDGHLDHVMLFAFADGRAPSPLLPADTEAIGATLALIHDAGRSIAHDDVPRFAVIDVEAAALAPPSATDALLRVLERVRRFDGSAPATLLHGDYGSHNLRMSAGEVRVFDFDECGVGPAEYDVANSLYLALFDLTVERGAGELFSAFRRDFLSSYDTVAATPLDRSAVDDLVILRAMMLSRWLAEPSIAPRGVAAADAAWKTRLAEFVTDFLAGPDAPA